MPWICNECGYDLPPDECPGCFRKTLTSFEEMHQEDSKELVRMQDELAEANEIIDKLPKCRGLRDGKLVQDVPVVPGMIVYLVGVGAVYGRSIDTIALDNGQWRFYRFQVLIGKPDECYDTREAAEFALSQVEQEKLADPKP